MKQRVFVHLSILALSMGTAGAQEESKLPSSQEMKVYYQELAKAEGQSCKEYMVQRPPTNTSFDPRHFVRIYEEQRSEKRVLLYDPRTPERRSSIFPVDADSKIVVEIDPCLLGPDMALNQLYMSGHINRGDKTANAVDVGVLNYSEIGKDNKTMTSQAGVSLETAGSVFEIISNLYWTDKELLKAAQPGCKGKAEEDTCYEEGEHFSSDNFKNALRRHQPEIESISSFFQDPNNSVVIGMIGSEVFGMDIQSLQKVAKNYASAAADVGGRKLDSTVEAGILGDLFARTVAIHNDFKDIKKETEVFFKTLEADKDRAYARGELYFHFLWVTKMMPRFREALLPGVIDLSQYKAADGDSLSLTLSGAAPGSQGKGGASADFQFPIRYLRPRFDVVASAFYIRRIHDVKDLQGNLTRVNFAPAPGVTLAETFFNRGTKTVPKDTDCAKEAKGRLEEEPTTRQRIYDCASRVAYSRWNTFKRALAPGIGVNASLLNFANAPIYDKAANNGAGGLKADTSSTVQIGAGVVVSFFDNALQATYGWDLNVNGKREYWGIGLGFAKVTSAALNAIKR